MKTKFIKFAVIFIVSGAFATRYLPFTDWDDVKRNSPDVIVARCIKTPNPYDVPKGEPFREVRSGLLDSDIEVVMVIKGDTKPGVARVNSRFSPRQGEHYLIFSHFHDNFYLSAEEYRIVPLGLNFPTNIVTGKSLDEQVQSVFRYRLSQLNRQLEQLQEEKTRLEAGIGK